MKAHLISKAIHSAQMMVDLISMAPNLVRPKDCYLELMTAPTMAGSLDLTMAHLILMVPKMEASMACDSALETLPV
jgi:hypothetical protein